jgi:hypothetical protein
LNRLTDRPWFAGPILSERARVYHGELTAEEEDIVRGIVSGSIKATIADAWGDVDDLLDDWERRPPPRPNRQRQELDQ